ncbi:MAG: YtxH domain-containing protein [Terriglobales bacterium]
MTDYERIGHSPSFGRSAFGIALTFLFIGLGAGALAGLLLAPKSGKQMRRNLRRKYEDAKDVLEEWGEQAGDMIDRGAEWANTAREKGSEWASIAREKVAPIGRVATRKF